MVCSVMYNSLFKITCLCFPPSEIQVSLTQHFCFHCVQVQLHRVEMICEQFLLVFILGLRKSSNCSWKQYFKKLSDL